jgi:bla regulator protein blaR1
MSATPVLVTAFVLFQAGLLAVLVLRPLAYRLMPRIDARAMGPLWILPLLAVATMLFPEPDSGQLHTAIQWTYALPQVPELTSNWIRSSDWLPFLAVFWLLGVLGLIVAAIIGHGRMRSRIQIDNAMSQRLGRNVARASFGPAVFGLLKPIIVLPPDFERRFSTAEQSLVLAHEIQHIDAKHLPIRTFAWWLLVLNWPSPLTWFAWRKFVEDQEASCDAGTLSRIARNAPDYFAQSRHDYARMLTECLSVSEHVPVFGGMCRMQTRHPTLRRIAMLRHVSRRAPIASALVVSLLVFGLGTVAWAAQTPSQATPLQDGSADLYRIKMQLSVDNAAPERFELVGKAGDRMGIKRDPGAVEMDLTLTPGVDDNSVMMTANIVRDGASVAKPVLVSLIGGEARVVVDDAPERNDRFDLSYTVFVETDAMVDAQVD